MARARKSHEGDVEKVKTRLEPAYGACGDNPYVVYADYKRDGEEHARMLVKIFKAKYAAKFFLDKLIRSDTWEECDPVGGRTGIITAMGIRITMFGEGVKTLIEYEPTEAEAAWRDDLVEKEVLRLKYGSAEGAKPKEEVTQISLVDYPADPDGVDPVKVKVIKEPKPVKEKKPKIDTSSMVSANDIAKKLKVEGREVRGVLRAMKLEKPAHGWAWSKDEAAKIEEKVSVALKEGKTKKK